MSNMFTPENPNIYIAGIIPVAIKQDCFILMGY